MKENEEDWRELCRQASVELDPQKLMRKPRKLIPHRS
jgi:hypothetical protein